MAADPGHGTVAAYRRCTSNHGQPCDLCRQAINDYRRAWRATGPRTVPAAPAARRLHILQTAGVSLRSIALRLGVSDSNLLKIASGRSNRIGKHLADRILGLQAIGFPDRLISSKLMWRRIDQSGIPISRLAPLVGRSTIRHTEQVEASFAERVFAVLDELAAPKEAPAAGVGRIRCAVCSEPLARHDLTARCG